MRLAGAATIAPPRPRPCSAIIREREVAWRPRIGDIQPPTCARPLPYGLLHRPAAARARRRARLPAGAPGGAVLPGVRAGPAVRPAGGVGRAGQLPAPGHRRLPVEGAAALGRVLLRQRRHHDGARYRRRAADAADVRSRSGSSCRPGCCSPGRCRCWPRSPSGSGSSTPSTASINWLLTQLGGRLRGPLLAARPAVVLLRRDRDRGLDERAVRRVHRVRRADPGAATTSSRRPRSTAPAPGSGSGTSCCPTIKPVLLIVGLLQVIWDLRVFTQIYVLQKAGGVTRDTNLLGTYIYRLGIGEGELRHGGRRRDVHARADRDADRAVRPDACCDEEDADEAGRGSPPVPGVGCQPRRVVVFVVCAFPVYWMVSTSFLTRREIRAPEPTWHPVRRHVRQLPAAVRRTASSSTRSGSACW